MKRFSVTATLSTRFTTICAMFLYSKKLVCHVPEQQKACVPLYRTSEDELTGSELLRDLDPPAPCLPADTIPAARSGRLEWPKKILQQTNLVSSIAAEI